MQGHNHRDVQGYIHVYVGRYVGLGVFFSRPFVDLIGVLWVPNWPDSQRSGSVALKLNLQPYTLNPSMEHPYHPTQSRHNPT